MKVECSAEQAQSVTSDVNAAEPIIHDLSEADLDPYTQAAIAAMRQRDSKKKAEALEKHKHYTPVLKKTVGCKDPKPAPKAAACKVLKLVPKVTKERAKKAEQAEVPANMIMKSMLKLPADGTNPKPVLYNKCIIYTSWRTKSFRALTQRGNNYSECSKARGGDKPTLDAWSVCVKKIDEKNK